jgi:tRNA threonylcarbamoyladenosine biosynthesis protein TsaB
MSSSPPETNAHRANAMLVIDTASRPGFLALSQADAPAGEWLAFRAFSHGRRQGEEIFPFLQEMLSGAELPLWELAGIVVTTGPGSFSALRIGLGAAKGLCETTGLALCGLSLLDVAATAAAGKARVVVLRAGRTDVYLEGFDPEGRSLEAPQVTTLAQWSLPASWEPEIVVAGEGALVEECAAHPKLGSLPVITVDEELPLRISAMGWSRLREGQLDDPLDALYVRRLNAGDAWVDPRDGSAAS